jgi:hypothetical protein
MSGRVARLLAAVPVQTFQITLSSAALPRLWSYDARRLHPAMMHQP